MHLYLSQVIREDSHTLYAFDQKEERNLFEMLLTVSGIGPKTAVAIIGHMEMNAFQKAIHTSDIRLLSKLPGIGKKTAERLILDMRDKFKVAGKKQQFSSLSLPDDTPCLHADAILALVNLGYNALQAGQAVNAAQRENPEETELGRFITLALQKI